MSEGHSGLPHDLPEYVPNWPVPPRAKVRVYRASDALWYWGHACPAGGWAYGNAFSSQSAAFKAALKHAKGCR